MPPNPPPKILHHHRFESELDARNEDLRRARGLNSISCEGRMDWTNMRERWKFGSNHRHLDRPSIVEGDAHKLGRVIAAGVEGGTPPTTLASALYFRSVREQVFDAMDAAFFDYADHELMTFTVIKNSWRFTPETMDTVSSEDLKIQFRADLDSIDLMSINGPLLAFLHGEFDPVAGIYQLHFHGVTTGEKAKALGKLKGRRGYVETPTGSPPIWTSLVNDRHAQLSYLLKSYWPEKGVRLVDGRTKRDRNFQRIKEPFHSQVLLWMDGQRLINLTLFSGGYSPRYGGSDAMKRLYVLLRSL